jgi:hypothetical protein
MKWVLVLVLVGCGGVSGTTGSGGTTGTGGAATGGETGTGGTSTGGATATGGSTGTGGTIGTGGTAGAKGTGGTSGTGGVSGTGGAVATGGATGTGGSGTCLADSADCTSTPNGCCSGVCLENGGSSQQHTCAAVCTADSQCVSGCCATLTNTTLKACSARGFCPETCAAAGVACTGSADCCANETCVTPSNTCAANCTTGAQCVSGCCAGLSNTSATGVCSDPIYCSATAAVERLSRM